MKRLTAVTNQLSSPYSLMLRLNYFTLTLQTFSSLGFLLVHSYCVDVGIEMPDSTVLSEQTEYQLLLEGRICTLKSFEKQLGVHRCLSCSLIYHLWQGWHHVSSATVPDVLSHADFCLFLSLTVMSLSPFSHIFPFPCNTPLSSPLFSCESILLKRQNRCPHSFLSMRPCAWLCTQPLWPPMWPHPPSAPI